MSDRRRMILVWALFATVAPSAMMLAQSLVMRATALAGQLSNAVQAAVCVAAFLVWKYLRPRPVWIDWVGLVFCCLALGRFSFMFDG